MAEKSLPLTPRSNYAPEVCYAHGLELAKRLNSASLEASHRNDAALEALADQGFKEPYEGLQRQETNELILVEEEERKRLGRRRRWFWIGAILLVLAAATIGGGVGGALKHRADLSSARDSSVHPASPTGTPFTSLPPLPSQKVTPAQWRGRSVYQVLTDRFSRSDSSTSTTCDTASRSYCGGSWQGLVNKLDYIQNMGFTAVWISPVTAQFAQNTSEGEGYHGYWQQSLYELNSNFGTASDLQALATALHTRGMYLMVDAVVNHFGWPGNSTTVDYGSFSPFNQQSFFHPYCPITQDDYTNNQSAVENCWLGDSIVSLPDVDTTNPSVIDTYQSWIKSLVTTFAIDGIRIDTVKHVQKSFWPGFNKAAGVYSIGEVLDGDPAYTCPYQDSLDGVLNYPLFFPLTEAFRNASGDMSRLSSMLKSVQSNCKDPTLMGTFIENHDNPRFPSLTSDASRNKNVIAFTLLADGIPIIYQGQEQHYSGGNDPHNREALWSSGYSTKSTLYGFIGSVNQIRNYEIYRYADYLTDKASVIHSDAHNIAMRKGRIVSVYSNQGVESATYNLTLSGTGYVGNQSLVEVLTCGNVTTDADGGLPVTIEQGVPKIYYPLGELSKSGVCYL